MKGKEKLIYNKYKRVRKTLTILLLMLTCTKITLIKLKLLYFKYFGLFFYSAFRITTQTNISLYGHKIILSSDWPIQLLHHNSLELFFLSPVGDEKLQMFLMFQTLKRLSL
jgi:hypothetical protein